jgi:hypothetical protein
MIGTALGLAAHGMHVFPCRPRAKMPATDHGFLDATTETEAIRHWWRTEPNYNVGIACGPSRIFVLDIDDGGESTLRKLEQQHGVLPQTIEVITPNNGRHLYFRMPDQPVRNSAGKLGPHIDVRGLGGYVLVPRSIVNNREYSWSVDCGNTIAEAPRWLLDRINGHADGKPVATPPSAWRALVIGGADEGRRNDATTRLAGYLLCRNVDALLVLELLQLWNAARCRPPLAEEEIEGIVSSVAGREIKRRAGNGHER